MEDQKYGRSFPGCMKGLVHFLDLHHHLDIRKMKMLAYRRHSEGKRAARSKEPETDPDAPSTSQQYNCTEDNCFGVEDKVSTRKHPVKSSMRIPIPKWGLRAHNKKRKVSPPASRLLRTLSIHHLNKDHMNFGVETSIMEQNTDVDKASSSSERVYILSTSFDEHSFDKLCDDNMAYSKSGSSGPSQPDEFDNILSIKQMQLSSTLNEIEVGSFAQKDTNAKELQEDVIFHPSKEFLAMMKLFNGNIELIQNILDDPSFIFAHYLHAKHASNAELMRACSFPVPWQLERKNDGQFKIKHKSFESGSLVKQIDKFHSENLHIIGERTPKLVETNIPSEQNVRNNPPNYNQFMTIKHNKKEHHHISMDGILHRIPFGRKVMKDMKKSKSGCRDGSTTMEKPEGESLIHASWRKINKHVKKNIQRSKSLNDSLDKYSYLYESISKEEFKGLPERMKVKSLGRVFSLPDIKYCSSSKNAQSEAPFSSSMDLTTSQTKKILEKEESKEFEQSESFQISKKLTKDGLIREENIYITPQGEKLLDEGLFDINAVDRLKTNKIDLARAKPFPDIDCFDSLHFQIDPKDEAKFNFVREILKRSRFKGSEFLEAWNSPYQPMDPLMFNEAEGFSYELDITEDEHDILLEHQLLFDLINEALVEIYEKFFGYFFPWLSRFNTNTRPMPMGSRILEEIWANICWHLKGQPQLGITLEDIVSRNFTKNDGWMNIQYDIEDVELELESLILDALLDDVVLQLSLSSSNPIPC